MTINLDDITVTLPIDEKDIPNVIQQLRTKIKVLNLEKEHIYTVVKQVQAHCSHSDTYRSGCYDGSTDTICNICGKYL